MKRDQNHRNTGDANQPQEPSSQAADRWADDLTPPASPPSRIECVQQILETELSSLVKALRRPKSEAFMEYLGALVRLHRYSFENIILINAQRPEASFVADSKTWEADFGRHVRRGERGLAILVPAVREAGVEEDSARSMTGESQGRDDYRVARVFDVSQTHGDPFLWLSETLVGPRHSYLECLKEDVRWRGIQLCYATDLGGALGRSHGGTIEIIRGLTAAQEFAVLVHEVAHELLHKHRDELMPDKATRELEAIAAGHVVLSAVGLPPPVLPMDSFRSYGRRRQKFIVRSLERIQEGASEILRILLSSSTQ